MTDHWFKPKSRGYGATPADWKGWAATAVFAIGLVAASYLLLVWEPSPGTGASALRIAVWALAIAVLTAVLSAWPVPRPMDNGAGDGESSAVKANKQGIGSQPGSAG